MGRGRVRLAERDAAEKRGRQHQGFERGAGRPAALGGEVELRLGAAAEEVAATHERLDRARGGIEGDERAGGILVRLRQHGRHRALGLGLPRHVEGGVDPEPAPEQGCLAGGGRGAEGGVVEHEPLHLLDEVGRGIAGPPEGHDAEAGRLGPDRRGPVGPSERDQLVEDNVAAAHGGRR